MFPGMQFKAEGQLAQPIINKDSVPVSLAGGDDKSKPAPFISSF